MLVIARRFVDRRRRIDAVWRRNGRIHREESKDGFATSAREVAPSRAIAHVPKL